MKIWQGLRTCSSFHCFRQKWPLVCKFKKPRWVTWLHLYSLWRKRCSAPFPGKLDGCPLKTEVRSQFNFFSSHVLFKVLRAFGRLTMDGLKVESSHRIQDLIRLKCRHGYYIRVTDDCVEGIKDENDEYSEFKNFIGSASRKEFGYVCQPRLTIFESVHQRTWSNNMQSVY